MALEIDCGKIEELISAEEIASINRVVTEPEAHWDKIEGQGLLLTNQVEDSMMELGREEDYFEKLNFEVIESLTETVLPLECRKNPDAVYLTSLILKKIASAQAFADGNKRTAYLASLKFLLEAQRQRGLSRTTALLLDENFLYLIQDAAVDNIDAGEVESYLKRGLGDSLEPRD